MLSYISLLFAAAIWGFAFVAQRKGMESLDPFTFNALRFALGALCVWLLRCLRRKRAGHDASLLNRAVISQFWQGPLMLGVLLFLAVSLQQTGMLWTGAGNAGFITGLYVVFVPIIGLFRGQRFRGWMLAAMALSVVGLALLNRSAQLNVSLGNSLVLLGAVFWALHVQMIDKLTKERPSLDLALVQYLVCVLLSLAASLAYRANMDVGQAFGRVLWEGIQTAFLPILYAGVMSVGIAFTLQLHAQKRVQPQAAAVILCLEAVFALLGGFLLLKESVNLFSILGALALFGAMLISVLSDRRDFLIDKKGAVKT
ncbi:MAG: DMT family transporter [Candidatus Syntrophosphaera sp.]|nr:DMT family transporter [Candidatus Syntrophosphaera sp.]